MSTKRNNGRYSVADQLANPNSSRRSKKSFDRNAYVSNPSNSSLNSALPGPHAGRSAAGATSAESARYAKLRKARKRKKIITGVVVGVVAVLLIGVGTAFAYINYINSQINGDVDKETLAALVPTDTSSDPFYMLLMGVDKSESRDASGEFGESYRCDTMILARIDPKNKVVSLVSLPRDLQIQNMGATASDPVGYGTQKLNAAYAFGGPALVIQTVSEISGVNISHYAEVDFDGFTAVVDAIGGIEMDVQWEIDDAQAGEYVPAGTNTLTGAQALSLCRSRHTYDEVGDGDSLRTAYQRQVVSAVAAKVLKSDVATIVNTVNSVVQYVNTDLDVATILGIASSLQGITSDSIYTASMPKTSKYVDGLWYDFVYADEWKEMVNRMNQGLPPADTEVDEATGIVLSSGGSSTSSSESASTATSPAHAAASVAVRNGTETSGIASKAVDKLKTFGYTNLSSGNANSTDYAETIVLYDEDTYKTDAEIIAAQIGVGKVQKNDGSYLMSSNVMVVLGADYSG